MDYSKDILIGNGPQGPFDHLMKLKSTVDRSCGPEAFNPSNLFLYAVTDSRMNKKWGRSITDAVKGAIEGGATIVQLRFVLLMCFVISIALFVCHMLIWRNYNLFGTYQVLSLAVDTKIFKLHMMRSIQCNDSLLPCYNLVPEYGLFY